MVFSQRIRGVASLTARHPRDELGVVPANVRIELFVPHSAVLKRSCVLVSHTGHGVVAKALYYRRAEGGVPLLGYCDDRFHHACYNRETWSYKDESRIPGASACSGLHTHGSSAYSCLCVGD
jgi:hypothetical protein